MNILYYNNKEYVTINTAANHLNIDVPLLYYYINKNRLKVVRIDKLKLVELDSLMQLNDYLAFRYNIG